MILKFELIKTMFSDPSMMRDDTSDDLNGNQNESGLSTSGEKHLLNYDFIVLSILSF